MEKKFSWDDKNSKQLVQISWVTKGLIQHLHSGKVEKVEKVEKVKSAPRKTKEEILANLCWWESNLEPRKGQILSPLSLSLLSFFLSELL